MVPTHPVSRQSLSTREFAPILPIKNQISTYSSKNYIEAPSLEKSKHTLPSDRPTLLSPSNLRLTKLVGEFELTLQSFVEYFTQRLSDITEESTEQSREYQKKLKEDFDKKQSGLLWSMLNKVWSAFFSAITAVFGLVNIAMGNILIGAALITSGILSLTNLICSEMGIWDEVAKKLAQENEERQKQIVFCIPLALSIMSSGLALFGGMYNLSHSTEFLSNQLPFVLMASLSIFNSIIEIGQGVTQSRRLYSQADLLKRQTDLELTNIQTKMCTEALNTFFSSMQSMFEQLSRIVQMSSQTNLAVLQA